MTICSSNDCILKSYNIYKPFYRHFQALEGFSINSISAFTHTYVGEASIGMKNLQASPGKSFPLSTLTIKNRISISFLLQLH